MTYLCHLIWVSLGWGKWLENRPEQCIIVDALLFVDDEEEDFDDDNNDDDGLNNIFMMML